MVTAGDLSDAELAAIMAAHDRELQEALRKHDASRQSQSDSLRQKLAEKRRKAEAELRDRQGKEVRTTLCYTLTSKFTHSSRYLVLLKLL